VKNAILFAVVLLVAAPAVAKKPAPVKPAPTSHFDFKIPEGWVDKTPPTTRASYRMAFDETNRLAFQAKVAPGAEPVTQEFLEKYASEAQKAVKRITGGELKVIKKDGFDVAGIISARFVFETPPPPDAPADAPPARQMQYYVPFGAEHALLTFTAPASTFDSFAPLFDKTARATVIRK
jgi:hypothetical protein